MNKLSWIYLILVLSFPAMAQSASDENLAVRVARLENSQGGQALSEMLDRIDQLQDEVQQLRGTIDEMRHTVDRMQDRQQSLYLDLDKRLLRVEEKPGSLDSPQARLDHSAADFESLGDVPTSVTEPENVVPSNPPDSESVAPPSSEESDFTRENREEPEQVADVSDRSSRGSGSAEAEKIYQEAFVFLNAGRYDDAIGSFSRTIDASPTGDLADNAQYWLGETYYVKRQFDMARSNFSQVVERYPSSNKIPDAMLKLGFIEYESGNWKGAREALNAVVQQYPGSNAAQLAQDRLNRMEKERH